MSKFAVMVVAISLYGVSLGSLAHDLHESKPVQQAQDITIGRMQGYTTEKCLELEARQTIEYRYQSPKPLLFHIHFHTESSTEIPLEIPEAQTHSGLFTADTTQEYCFTWKSPVAATEDWVMHFQYNIQPLANPQQ